MATILDTNYLTQMRQATGNLGPDALSDVIGLFFERSEQLLKTLRQAMTNGDISRICWVAHTLRSSAAALGGQEFALQLKFMEEAGSANTLETLNALERDYLALKTAMENELSRLRAQDTARAPT